MKKFKPVLDTLILEIRYDFGNLYYDRCGLCLNDIEESRKGWHAIVASNNTGQLEDPEHNFIVSFSNRKYDFTANKIESSGTNIPIIIDEATHIWKIIQANLGLTEFT
jgi:hypothetical protein